MLFLILKHIFYLSFLRYHLKYLNQHQQQIHQMNLNLQVQVLQVQVLKVQVLQVQVLQVQVLRVQVLQIQVHQIQFVQIPNNLRYGGNNSPVVSTPAWGQRLTLTNIMKEVLCSLYSKPPDNSGPRAVKYALEAPRRTGKSH